MTGKRSLYILLVIAVAGFSALTGALAGGAMVYRILQQNYGSPPNTANTNQTLMRGEA